MVEQTNPKRILAGRIGAETGITPKEIAGAAAAQSAAEQTTAAAHDFAFDRRIPGTARSEPDRKPHGITIISPYEESELSEKEELLKKAGIEFGRFLSQEHKPHLLSALALASHVGIDPEETVNDLNAHIGQEKERLPYLARSGITYELGSYLIEEYIVRTVAKKKGLEAPERLNPAEERKSFMLRLARSLDENEKEQLARYIASTQARYSISPFYSPVSFDVSNKEGLRRQNIALAITPQKFETAQIESFLSQEGIRKEMFLVAMANPYLQEAMPLGAAMAGEYRITSADRKKEVSIREALEEQIEGSYTEKPIGSESKGLLPFEEIAGLIVVDNLRGLATGGLESRFTQAMPQVLEAEEPLVKLEEEFPDIRLFFDTREMDRLGTDIDALKEAIAHPDQVPPRDFWYRVFTKPDKTYGYNGYLTQVRNRLIHQVYQTGGESHVQRWKDVSKGFVVSEGQDRNGDPLTLILVNDHEVGVSGKDGPRYSLVRKEDGYWYPTSYWDKKSQKPIFDIGGMSYDELKTQVAASPFHYQMENGFLREILRGSFDDLAARVYEQIKDQCDLEAIQGAGFYPSHAATAYREEGFLKDFQYLIGGMNPYGVGIYDSIFSAFVRHLWQHGKLSETDLSVDVPLTGESVTARHPLLELPGLSFEEIQRRLKETSADVRVPEITIRKSGGYELRAKAGVYDTLLKLKEIGFDAVLGKTMAKEFNRQAARIYVESALADLGFLPDDYQREKPLAALQSRQQKLYDKALELDFTIPLKSGHRLDSQLTVPLTWDRERELVQFIEGKLTQDELQEFYKDTGISDYYFETRVVDETFLNFASGWKWNQFDRSKEFPTYTYQSSGYGSGVGSLSMSRSVGEYAVSTQAQERFIAAKKTWGEFLDEINRRTLRLDAPLKQRISPIVDLGRGLVAEIDKMSQAEVTEWAEKIIKGEMAAVGRDIQEPIEVKTWTDFHAAVSELMNTARLILTYRSEKGRFGWEVSTDKEELS